MMLLYSLILIFSLLFSGGQEMMQQDIVQIKTAETILRKEKTDTINVAITVKEGYHIQADKVNDESLVPAALKVTPMPEFGVDTPVFPAYKLFRLEGTRIDLNVFDGRFLIKIPARALSATDAGEYIMKGIFQYQACDHKSCLFPRTIAFEMSILVQ